MKKDSGIYSLFQIGISIHHLNKKSEREIGISLVQWCLLKQLVDRPAISAFDLSKAVGVHPSTLTQTLKRLQKKKLIFIIADTKDFRKKVISLTRQGKEILDKATHMMSDWSKKLAAYQEELGKVRAVLSEKVNAEIHSENK